PAVGGDEPVALSGGAGGRGHDRLVEGDAPGGAEEPCVAEAEHPAVGGNEPVAPSGGAGGRAHDRLVEGGAPGGAEEAAVTEAEDPAVGGNEPVARAKGHAAQHDRLGAVRSIVREAEGGATQPSGGRSKRHVEGARGGGNGTRGTAGCSLKDEVT